MTKRIKEVKTQEERQQIADNLKVQIENLGIPTSHDGISEFLKVLDEYSQPHVPSGLYGKIKIPEINRRIEYTLPVLKGSPPTVKMVTLI